MKKYSSGTDLWCDIQQDSRFENSVLFATLNELRFYSGEERNAFNYPGCAVVSHPGFNPDL